MKVWGMVNTTLVKTGGEIGIAGIKIIAKAACDMSNEEKVQ